MIKLNVLYGHPTDRVAFETYYSNTRFPLAAPLQSFEKIEYSTFISGSDGSQAEQNY